MEVETTEGGLAAPERHPLPWMDPEFSDPQALNAELERVFDICHLCRRCVNLCQAFPTLFDLIDESETLELDSVAKEDYQNVVDQCFLCDLCFQTKCPYVPPHEWNVDFPHLMLRAKYARFQKDRPALRDRMLTSTDNIGKFLGIPIVAPTVNAVNRNKTARKLMEPITGIHRDATLPTLYSASKTARVRHKSLQISPQQEPDPSPPTVTPRPRVMLFATCYLNYNEPKLFDDLLAVLQHNNVEVELPEKELCCGMPKMEMGDLETVAALKDKNIPYLKAAVDRECTILAAVPSCVLMFRKELPLLFPQDEDVLAVAKHCQGPFEYLQQLNKKDQLNTDFSNSLGKVAMHYSCHQRVQNVGLPMRDIMHLIPDTEVTAIERCSGHDGTYALKKKTFDDACKIGRPIARKIDDDKPDHYGSDCPLACSHIGELTKTETPSQHPISLLRHAYGI